MGATGSSTHFRKIKIQVKLGFRETGIYFSLRYHQDIYIILNLLFEKIKFNFFKKLTFKSAILSLFKYFYKGLLDLGFKSNHHKYWDMTFLLLEDASLTL